MLQLTASDLIPLLQDPGTYVPGVFTSKADCIDCPAGHACAGGPSQPSICLPGNIAPLSRSTADRAQCAKCAAGTFQEAEGATACETCTAGSYCKQGASAALPCLSGSYSSASGLGEASLCTDCPKGSACSTGSTAHVLCAPGTFATAAQSSCTECAAGYACPFSDENVSIPCASGTFSIGGADACTDCPAGFACSGVATSAGGHSRGFGFVTFVSDKGARYCLKEAGDPPVVRIEGRECAVRYAEQKDDHGARRALAVWRDWLVTPCVELLPSGPCLHPAAPASGSPTPPELARYNRTPRR